jgi:hypothetical protein
MTVAGGLRARFVHDSFHVAVKAGLNDLGWLDSTVWDNPPGVRRHRPVAVLAEPLDWDRPVEPNVVAVSFSGSEATEIELGSMTIIDGLAATIDLLAESDSFADNLIGDVRDLLRGRLAGRKWTFPIYDFRHATPPVLGYGEVDEVRVIRTGTMDTAAWRRHWHQLTCRVQHSYPGG